MSPIVIVLLGFGVVLRTAFTFAIRQESMVVPPNGAGPGRSASGMHGNSTRTKLGPTDGLSTINIPLSARRAERLDMNTVERKNRREPPARTHVNGVQEAPTFRPTEEEWKDPMEYMRKIAAEGSKYGIVKLIPPESWNPDFVIDTEVRQPKRRNLYPRICAKSCN